VARASASRPRPWLLLSRLRDKGRRWFDPLRHVPLGRGVFTRPDLQRRRAVRTKVDGRERGRFRHRCPHGSRRNRSRRRASTASGIPPRFRVRVYCTARRGDDDRSSMRWRPADHLHAGFGLHGRDERPLPGECWSCVRHVLLLRRLLHRCGLREQRGMRLSRISIELRSKCLRTRGLPHGRGVRLFRLLLAKPGPRRVRLSGRRAVRSERRNLFSGAVPVWR